MINVSFVNAERLLPSEDDLPILSFFRVRGDLVRVDLLNVNLVSVGSVDGSKVDESFVNDELWVHGVLLEDK